MKKILAVVFGALFVFSFAAGAFAASAEIPSDTTAVVAKGATQITLGGELRTRGWYESNISSGAPIDTKAASWYDERVRLDVNASVAAGVQGYVQLESGSGQSDTYVWGNFDQKPGSLSILQAWILHKGSGLLGIPAGLKVGHMPLALGEGQFFDHRQYGDDALVFFMDPNKQTHIGLLTVKFDGEGNTTELFAGALKGSKTDNNDDLDGYVALITYKWDDKNTVGLNFTDLNQSDLDFSQQDLGLHANGNISGLGYKAEIDMQFGHMGEGSSEVKFRGYGILLGANYKVDPINIRAGFALGSGDDGEDADKNKAFWTYVDHSQHYTLVYEYQVNSTAGARYTGISNTTYYNLGVDYSPAKDWNTALDLFLLRATKTVGDVSKSAGWEVDAKVKYNVAKNLTYQIDAGYLKAGTYYEDTNGDKKSATVLRHMLTLSF